jgi:hypothetical protein
MTKSEHRQKQNTLTEEINFRNNQLNILKKQKRQYLRSIKAGYDEYKSDLYYINTQIALIINSISKLKLDKKNLLTVYQNRKNNDFNTYKNN